MTTALIYIALLLLFTTMPAVVVWLCRRFRGLGKIGPIMLLYAIGVCLGNLPALPEEMKTLQELLPNITVPLAIPMMLFGCSFSRQETGTQLRVIVSGFLSVCVAVIIGHLLFAPHIEEGAEVGGIIAGMYTGGTLNAAALQTIFRIDTEDYLLINSYDILISFVYFIFLFTCGIRLFRFLYRNKGQQHVTPDRSDTTETTPSDQEQPYRGLTSKRGLRALAKLIFITLLIVALSAGMALLFPAGWFMAVFILMLTTLGVACSFIRPIRTLPYSYDIGMYLIYIFSLAIASMADLRSFDLAGGLYQIALMSFAVFGSLMLHAVICRLLRVDADSMILSSVAFINSPPFVPMVAAAMGNKKGLVIGLGAGIAGYALGNHFGVLMAQLLALL